MKPMPHPPRCSARDRAERGPTQNGMRDSALLDHGITTGPIEALKDIGICGLGLSQGHLWSSTVLSRTSLGRWTSFGATQGGFRVEPMEPRMAGSETQCRLPRTSDDEVPPPRTRRVAIKTTKKKQFGTPKALRGDGPCPVGVMRRVSGHPCVERYCNLRRVHVAGRPKVSKCWRTWEGTLDGR